MVVLDVGSGSGLLLLLLLLLLDEGLLQLSLELGRTELVLRWPLGRDRRAVVHCEIRVVQEMKSVKKGFLFLENWWRLDRVK